MDEKHVIRRYVRNQRTGKLDGILIAGNINNMVYITAAKVRNNSGDVFCKSKGYKIAKARLECASKGRKVTIPASFESELPTFIQRCKNYYQTESIMTPFVDSFHKETVSDGALYNEGC
jgi:hypothetical protein